MERRKLRAALCGREAGTVQRRDFPHCFRNDRVTVKPSEQAFGVGHCDCHAVGVDNVLRKHKLTVDEARRRGDGVDLRGDGSGHVFRRGWRGDDAANLGKGLVGFFRRVVMDRERRLACGFAGKLVLAAHA